MRGERKTRGMEDEGNGRLEEWNARGKEDEGNERRVNGRRGEWGRNRRIKKRENVGKEIRLWKRKEKIIKRKK